MLPFVMKRIGSNRILIKSAENISSRNRFNTRREASLLKFDPDKITTKAFHSKGRGVPISSQLLKDSGNTRQAEITPIIPKVFSRPEATAFMEGLHLHPNSTALVEYLDASNLKILDDREVSPVFSTLFRALRYETSDKAKKDILNSVGIQKVFKYAKQYARLLNVSELITVIKFMVFLNTPGSHPVLQMFLRLLSKQANSLMFNEIIYVSFLLEKLTPSPMVLALKMALPVICESHIRTKLDPDDPGQLSEALQYVVQNNLTDDVVQKVIDDLLKKTDKISPRHCLSIIWALSDLKRNLLRQDDLLTRVFERFTPLMEQINMDELASILWRLGKRFSKVSNQFYNEEFVGKFCHLLIESSHDPSKFIASLRGVTQMRHVDIAILDRLSELVLLDPSIILNNDMLLGNVLKAFAGANYKPEDWTMLEPILVNHPYLTKGVQLWTLPLVIDFLALDSFPANLVSNLFSMESKPVLEEYVKLHSPYIPILILQYVKKFRPEYKGNLPPQSLVDCWHREIMKIPKSFPLKPALQSGIGGANYILSNLFHEGFHIDHAVAYRKGGFPVALDVEEPIQLNDLSLPAECDLVMIKSLLPDSFASNTNRLRGIYALELRLIESLGYPVIAIDVARWSELPSSERIPYLMQKLKDKMDVSTKY